MPPLHFSFLEHSVAAIAEALRLYKQDRRKGTWNSVDLPRIATLVLQAHLGVEKLIKHGVARVDPYLLLEDLKKDALRDISRDVRGRNLPSLFAASSTKSSNADQAWDLAVKYLNLPFDSAVASAMATSLRALTDVRNQAQHGEMFVDPVEVLATVERVLARLPGIAKILAPEFLAGLEHAAPQRFMELMALAENTGASWLKLYQLLAAGQRLGIEADIYVTSKDAQGTISLSVSTTSAIASSHDSRTTFLSRLATQPKRPVKPSLSLQATAERGAATGLFGHQISQEEAKARHDTRTTLVHRRIIRNPNRKPPPAPPYKPRGLLDDDMTPLAETLWNAMMSGRVTYEEERAFVERHGFPTLEAGSINFPDSLGALTLPAAPRSLHSIAGEVFVRECVLEFRNRGASGRFHAVIDPDVGTSPGADIAKVQLGGRLWLTNELVVDDDSRDSLTKGTVIRYLRGRLQFELVNPSPIEPNA